MEGVAVAAVSAVVSTAVSTSIGEVSKAAIEHGRHTSQKHDLERNYKRLIKEAEMLYSMRNDKELDADKHKEKKFTKEGECWISTVRELEGQMRELQAQYNKQKNKGKIQQKVDPRLRNFRSKLKIDVAEKWEELQSLILRGKNETFLVEKSPESVRPMHVPKTKAKSSPHWAIKAILGLLRDANIRRIGLWGMPGIGKSTIMKKLNDNIDIAKMFDIVIFLNVPKKECIEMLQDEIAQRSCNKIVQDEITKKRCIKMLQDQIAQRLNLNIKDINCPKEIAWRISKELECKRYLLLLDEVYDSLDLNNIGVLDAQKDSKVVLATRYRPICFHMKTNELIKMKCLSDSEAYEIFKEEVGDNINVPGVEPIAKSIASKCGGLPLLIEKVAKSFSPKDSFELWSDGERNFQGWPRNEVQGMDELIEILKNCYEGLDCENKRFCFLYSALYPEDFEIYIDDLLDCWIAEGFIHAKKFRVAREKGHTILYDLINVSLLERTEKKNHVSMNKVLRSMAFKISSESNNFKVWVKTPQEQWQSPSEEEWQQANRISLINNDLCIFPEMPNCKNLSTLLLQRTQEVQSIPDSFFRYMKTLRVLDLQHTGIISLPSSISCLTCLRALYLRYCANLVKLSFNEKELPHLEVLDIRDTKINYLPIEVRYLTQLKSLRTSLSSFGMEQSKNLEFHQNILSVLALLEELIVDVIPNNPRWEEVLKAAIEEVTSLPHLASLSICFPTADCLQSFVERSPSWKQSYFRFQFSVGHHDSTKYQVLNYFDYQITRCLKLVNGISVHPAISSVLAETYAFDLIDHQGALELSDFDVSCLRGCWIERCSEIQTIVNGDKIRKSVLERLEKMYINNVPRLTSIWQGVVHAGSLAQLKTLALKKCMRLKKIFSDGMIAQLSKLQSLKVDECSEIEEIIMASENQRLDPNALPSLKELALLNLPKVSSIWINDSLNWSSLRRVEVFACPLLKNLPFNNKNAINLECLELQQSWWDVLEWQEDATKERIQSLCTFK